MPAWPLLPPWTGAGTAPPERVHCQYCTGSCPRGQGTDDTTNVQRVRGSPGQFAKLLATQGTRISSTECGSGSTELGGFLPRKSVLESVFRYNRRLTTSTERQTTFSEAT